MAAKTRLDGLARWAVGWCAVGVAGVVQAADVQVDEVQVAEVQVAEVQVSEPPLNGELRLSWTGQQPGARGPLALAERLTPGIAPPPADSALAELVLSHTRRGRWLDTPIAWAGSLQMSHRQPDDAGHRSDVRFNELHASADLGAWQASVGKKVVGWDVGHGFRPNDVVQQETRRSLLTTPPEGRTLLQLEYFGADRASTWVWVNPQRLRVSDNRNRGADESALAWRGYQRHGSADAFGFVRLGEHTRASLGAALAWVPGDAIEWHASARRLLHHDGWAIEPGAGDLPAAANPWRQSTLGRATQWQIGASWTGEHQQSLLIEAWHDGTALSDVDWQRWHQRNAALAAVIGPAVQQAGNLAWQATPLNSANLRRDNVLVRASWQPDHWLWAVDALYTPADQGHVLTASAQWQGERWRLNAAWRLNGGPDQALHAQLPNRSVLLLAATCAF